ncbi:MAG: guanylate kinase, partial [Agathobacter sp.]|nr:guanylate kinase [Agathobacter sp.]
DGEEEGKEYHFATEEDVQRLEEENLIIELRAYNTIHGIWKYFTVNDGSIELDKESYMLIGTLETYVKIRDYFGEDRVIPIYIEVEDGERLARALKRERKPENQKYEEMCRRFLADSADFSEEKIKEARVTKRFINDDRDETLEEVKAYIESMM